MLADIHHKISQSGRNLSDRMEDKLTGDFFGAIRYLPFQNGLRHVLSSARFNDSYIQNDWLQFLKQTKDYEAELSFRPRHQEGEIDLIVRCSHTLIGIEGKYLSGLSSDDQEEEQVIDYKESRNQLARYSRMLKELSEGQPSYLLFLAPFDMMNAVKKSVQDRPIISPSVSLGFLCWQDVLEALNNLDTSTLDTGRQLIVNDLQALLLKKNLTRFHGFNLTAMDETITRTAYTFQSNQLSKKANWTWPATNIKEGTHYDFNC